MTLQTVYATLDRMSLYRKKPVVVEARQYTLESKDEVYKWVSQFNTTTLDSSEQGRDFAARFGFNPLINAVKDIPGNCLWIPTLEGVMRCNYWDWVICGVRGEFYPCDRDIFAETYEAVVDTRKKFW